MNTTVKPFGMVGYYANCLILPNGDLAIMPNMTLWQEWSYFKRTGKYEHDRSMTPLPEDERTPRNLKLANSNQKLTILSLLSDFDEQSRQNGGCGLEVIDEHEYPDFGALTSAPILAYEVDRDYDQDNRIKSAKYVWWFPDYAVEDELETLLEKMLVIFKLAPDEKETE